MPISTGNAAPPKSIKSRKSISSVKIQIGARRRGAPRRSCRAPSGQVQMRGGGRIWGPSFGSLSAENPGVYRFREFI